MGVRPKKYTIKFLESDDGSSPYRKWFAGLKEKTVQSRVDARLARVRDGNLGDHRDLGGGINELRLFFGPGYRIYFAYENETIILLLAGGGKRFQAKDIEAARNLYAEFLGAEDG